MNGELTNNDKVWQTTELMKLENKGTSNYWLSKSSNTSRSGDFSILGIFVFACQTSELNLATSSFTHRPRVTKAHATLDPRVSYSYTNSYARLLSKLTPSNN